MDWLYSTLENSNIEQCTPKNNEWIDTMAAGRNN